MSRLLPSSSLTKLDAVCASPAKTLSTDAMTGSASSDCKSETAGSDTSRTSARLVYPMLNGVASKHGDVPSSALAHRCTVAPSQDGDDEVPI
eukprot:scaffold22737_cov32-Tisochrysis_lutea.AAC.5